MKNNSYVLAMFLALCSNIDHLEMLTETGGYKGAAVFLREAVYGFLFYAQDVHNDHKDIKILCFLSQFPFNGTNFTLQRRKIFKILKKLICAIMLYFISWEVEVYKEEKYSFNEFENECKKVFMARSFTICAAHNQVSSLL